MAKPYDDIFFEELMRRAFQISPMASIASKEKVGAANSKFKPVVYYEEGASKGLLTKKNYEKYIATLQSQLAKAFDKFLNMKDLLPAERGSIEAIRGQIKHANSADTILDVVHQALDATARLKDKA